MHAEPYKVLSDDEAKEALKELGFNKNGQAPYNEKKMLDAVKDKRIEHVKVFQLKQDKDKAKIRTRNKAAKKARKKNRGK